MCQAIHSILTDEVKRKLYDETGEVDGDGHTDLSDESFEFWDNYFRSLFPKVTVEGIQAFSALYKGSTGENGSEHNERQDILDAYVQYEGNFSHIMESVILAEEEDEERITSVISAAIESGEVEAYLAFDEHLASLMNASGGKKKKSSKKKQKREASISHSTDEGEAAEKGKKSNKKKKGGANDSIDDLAAMILGGRKKQQNAMSSIFAKYGGAEEDGDEYNISDEAFERTRATLNASKSKKKPKSSKSSKKS
jgi:DnaJ family protein C protein 9